MIEKKCRIPYVDHRELLHRQAGKLADMLIQSPEYEQFQSARKRLESDGKNATALANLRQQQMDIRMSAMLGEDVGEDISDLERSYRIIAGEPAVSDYLFAEGRLLKLISEIEDVFSSKLDLGRESEEIPAPRVPYDIHLN